MDTETREKCAQLERMLKSGDIAGIRRLLQLPVESSPAETVIDFAGNFYLVNMRDGFFSHRGLREKCYDRIRERIQKTPKASRRALATELLGTDVAEESAADVLRDYVTLPDPNNIGCPGEYYQITVSRKSGVSQRMVLQCLPRGWWKLPDGRTLRVAPGEKVRIIRAAVPDEVNTEKYGHRCPVDLDGMEVYQVNMPDGKPATLLVEPWSDDPTTKDRHGLPEAMRFMLFRGGVVLMSGQLMSYAASHGEGEIDTVSHDLEAFGDAAILLPLHRVTGVRWVDDYNY